jgi:hypothetical protein
MLEQYRKGHDVFPTAGATSTNHRTTNTNGTKRNAHITLERRGQPKRARKLSRRATEAAADT